MAVRSYRLNKILMEMVNHKEGYRKQDKGTALANQGQVNQSSIALN